MLQSKEKIIAPGARIVVRDAEWLVRKVDNTSSGTKALMVTGISELVKDKEAIFLEDIEKDRGLEILNPVDTKLEPDTSSSFQSSILYIESLLRQTPPTDENLYIGHKAAMDLVPYQLDPAIQALKQPRQRILIADAVGLGKTLECGVLMSELIRRGKGKRILVLAVKSMLTQFQKEMWSRFTIPLVRLDSVGIQRVRSRIPTNHNPFYYYDKSIISIDTLKQDREYRTYLENAYWDIIVIDEAHNVAERNKGRSLRSKLAKLLASRSDTLLMLSATPHDGKASSFASLMNMLDPTAIADPDKYGPEDIKGLFIRRFKKHIQKQVTHAFKEREISKSYSTATLKEEKAFGILSDLKFTTIDGQRSAGQLFKTTLEKSLFSSPAACLETVQNRIGRLEKRVEAKSEKDVSLLKELASAVKEITPIEFSKYQKLLQVIKDKPHGFGWTGADKTDRLVIFTERIETLNFLAENLTKDLKLKKKQVLALHGSMSDKDQQHIVEDFGKEEAPVRLLLASDVASEGINLHFLSHRLIHFDIPWSLMVFQQRNGRIDRYGQEKTPFIHYLITKSDNPKIKGDMRILELLIQKDDEAVKNIGDPSVMMGVYAIDEEEKITAAAMDKGNTPEEFEQTLTDISKTTFDPLALLMGDAPAPVGESSEENLKEMPSLFENDYTYIKTAINHLIAPEILQAEFYDQEQQIELTASADLKHRLKNILPGEAWPDDDVFVFSTDKEVIQKEIKESRKEEMAWPKIQYLWSQNPVLEWVNDKAVAAFSRHEAKVMTIHDALERDEVVFLLSGVIPNRKSHPLIHRWFGVTFQGNLFSKIEPLIELLDRTGLGKKEFPNRGTEVDREGLKKLLPQAVSEGKNYLLRERKTYEDQIDEKLNQHLKGLERLRGKQHEQLELFPCDKRSLSKKDERRREIDTIFDEFLKWTEDTMTTEANPYIQVAAVLRGSL